MQAHTMTMTHAAFLQDVTSRIQRALGGHTPPGLERSSVLDQAGQYLALAPGAKRARPRLVWGFAQILGATDQHEALGQIALSAEFIHGASLLHDDVVDGGAMRRGRATVNAAWSAPVAVLGGDVMLCISIQALDALPRPITFEAVEVVATMSRAAILEVETRGKSTLPLDQWQAIAQGKTGALFGWCGRAVALLQRDMDAAARFEACGKHLGVAFQLADDLRDMMDENSGKTRFADILNKNPSYPLLWATAQSPALSAALQVLWAKPHIHPQEAAHLGQMVLDTGAPAHTSAQILAHVAQAFEALGPYRERPGAGDVFDWASSLSRAYVQGIAPPGPGDV